MCDSLGRESQVCVRIPLSESRSDDGFLRGHNVYANINCFVPAFPGDAEYPLSKGKPVTRKHRVWIVEDVPSQGELQSASERASPFERTSCLQ